jgi:ABC-type multidrug transport system ATPase subunit
MEQAHAEAISRPDGTIAVEGLSHVYKGNKGGVEALSGVDLEIGTGLFGLLGPNGAGKSTLMKILCTLLVPTAGRARVCGHDVVTERRAVRQQLGYLPQEFGAWRVARVEEALDTLALLSGLADRARRRQRVGEALEQVGLAAVADRKVKKLSGGMLRRLGVAQALVHQPRVLVVDEPTVGLDPEERIRFRQLMADLGQERTIVLSTHIVADLGSGCRDLALLAGGKLVYRGTPEELLRRAAGKVFEITVGVGGEERLGTDVEIVSRARDGVGTRLRGVLAQGGLPAGADPVDKPTLEEAYLAFMAARGHRGALVGAAREEES